MTKPWNTHRREITDLYLKDGHRLEDVRNIMKERHDFQASVRAYRHHFDQWNVTKYNRKSRQGRRPSASSTRPRDTASSADSPPPLMAGGGSEDDMAASPELASKELPVPEYYYYSSSSSSSSSPWPEWRMSFSPGPEPPCVDSPVGSFDTRSTSALFGEEKFEPRLIMPPYQSPARRDSGYSTDSVDSSDLDEKVFYNLYEVPCGIEHPWILGNQFYDCGGGELSWAEEPFTVI
jgi:hypothetical protein